MVRGRLLLTRHRLELPISAVGHLLALNKNTADGPGVVGAGSRWAAHTQAGRVRATSLRPLERRGTCQQALRRVRGLDGKRDEG